MAEANKDDLKAHGKDPKNESMVARLYKTTMKSSPKDGEMLQKMHKKHPKMVEAVNMSHAHSKEWNWEKAGEHMDRAYTHANEDNPFGTDHVRAGHALHRGEHPVQISAMSAEDSDLGEK